MTLEEAREVARSIAKIDTGGADVSLRADKKGEDFYLYSVGADGFYGYSTESWEKAIEYLRENHVKGLVSLRERLEADKKNIEDKIANLEEP